MNLLSLSRLWPKLTYLIIWILKSPYVLMWCRFCNFTLYLTTYSKYIPIYLPFCHHLVHQYLKIVVVMHLHCSHSCFFLRLFSFFFNAFWEMFTVTSWLCWPFCWVVHFGLHCKNLQRVTRKLCNRTLIKIFRWILLVDKTFPRFPALEVQNCLKLEI